MLSKTFRTAKELRISQEAYDALVAVYWLLVDETIPEKLFDMGTIGSPKIGSQGKPCGSAGCILAWCNAVAPGVIKSSEWVSEVQGPLALNNLFFDNGAINTDVTRAQGAQAIHNYLTTGRANWRGVLKG